MTGHPARLDVPDDATQEQLAFAYAAMLRDCHDDRTRIPCEECAHVAMPPIDDRFLVTLEAIVATGVRLHRDASDRLN